MGFGVSWELHASVWRCGSSCMRRMQQFGEDVSVSRGGAQHQWGKGVFALNLGIV